jgi:hypothetical protein
VRSALRFPRNIHLSKNPYSNPPEKAACRSAVLPNPVKYPRIPLCHSYSSLLMTLTTPPSALLP